MSASTSNRNSDQSQLVVDYVRPEKDTSVDTCSSRSWREQAHLFESVLATRSWNITVDTRPSGRQDDMSRTASENQLSSSVSSLLSCSSAFVVTLYP